MNQSELEANEYNWEKKCEQIATGFSFVSHWLSESSRVLLTNHRGKVKQYQSNYQVRIRLTFVIKFSRKTNAERFQRFDDILSLLSVFLLNLITK